MIKEGYHQQIREHLQMAFHLSDEKIDTMMPNFLTTIAGHLQATEEIYASGNLSNLSKAGHKLKGALLNLGLSELAEIALALEQRADQEDTNADYNGMLTELKGEITKIV